MIGFRRKSIAFDHQRDAGPYTEHRQCFGGVLAVGYNKLTGPQVILLFKVLYIVSTHHFHEVYTPCVANTQGVQESEI